jgi:hypothetical protein
MRFAVGGKTELVRQSRQILQSPTMLCYWSVHVSENALDKLKRKEVFDNWEPARKEWPERWKLPAFEERLKNALITNNFSNIKTENLPVALPQLAKTINDSTNQVLEMSLGFVIIAGNYGLVEELLGKAETAKVNLSGLYPYHLATSYLDGSVECCHIFGLLCRKLGGGNFSLSRCYTNALGHTVLDNLMIAILKGHTAVTPSVVDNVWRSQTRFAGDEIDICGRWAPDSNELSPVLSSGVSPIPVEWRHKFCHTSAQVILHCIQAAEFHGAKLNTASGLFPRICVSCGLRLQLQPLHTLVFTAFELAQFGCTGEDLFGIIACLLCLLHLGVDPLQKSTISITALLDQEQGEVCCHSEITPLELAKSLYFLWSDTWSHELQVGWKIICHILRLSEVERADWNVRDLSSTSGVAALNSELVEEVEETTESLNGYAIGCDDCIWGEGFFGNNKYLGHIWAAVQTELLTHRRLQNGDRWVSENFDMNVLLESLDRGSELTIKLVKGGVMRKYCSCGSFTEAPWPKVNTGKQVTASILESNKYFDASVREGAI